MALTPNVVDGQIILASWGNAIRDRTIQRFATPAERDALWPAATAGAGAYCVTVDTLTVWVSSGTVWRRPPGATYLSQSYSVGETNWAGGALRDILFGNFTPPIATMVTVTTAVYWGFAGAAIGAQVDLVRLTDATVAATVTHLASPAGAYGLAVRTAATWPGAVGAESGFKVRINAGAGSQYYTATASALVTAA